MAYPTNLAFRGCPISRATCPYETTVPRGTRRTVSYTLSLNSPIFALLIICCGNVICSRIIIGAASTSLLPISCGYRVPKLRALYRRTQEEDVLNRGSRVQIPHGAATVTRQRSCRPARTPARKRACASGVSPRTRPRSRLYCVAKQPRRIVICGKPSLSVFCGSASPIPRVCVQKRTRKKRSRCSWRSSSAWG